MPLCTLISCFVKWGEKGLWGRGMTLYTQANSRKGSEKAKTSIRSCSKMRKKKLLKFQYGKNEIQCNFCRCTSKGSAFKFCNVLSLVVQTEPNLHYYILGKGIKQDFNSHPILVITKHI